MHSLKGCKKLLYDMRRNNPFAQGVQEALAGHEKEQSFRSRGARSSCGT
jgi:hypothetical protein